MNAYFDVIKQLFWMMVFLTVVTIPACYIYGSYSTLSPYVMFDNYSLGNMGGSSIACGNVPLAVPGAVLTLSCPAGTIQTSATTSNGSLAFQTGIIPDDALASNYCMTSAIQVPAGSDTVAQCAQYFNVDAVTAAVAATCNGQTSCSIVFNSAESGFNLNYFNYSPSYPSVCYQDSASVFVSAGCILSTSELSDRQVQGLFIGCIFVSVALFSLVYFDFMKQIAKNNFVEWDVKTVTAGDYTIEFDIEEPFWQKFLELHGSSKPIGTTMVVHFRNWITKEMEDKLSALPDLGFEDHEVTRVKIASTNFAFDNAELIVLLKQRGAAISADDFDTMRALDKQINELKKAKLDSLTRPVSVFMTFENEEGI